MGKTNGDGDGEEGDIGRAVVGRVAAGVKTAGREMVEGEMAATGGWKVATGREIVGRATAAAGRRWSWWQWGG